MDSVIRAVLVYGVLLVLLRLSGKRTLSDVTVFDFVLLLIISEATQPALLADDFSLVNGFIVIITLVLIDILLSYLKQRFRGFEKWAEGVPVIILKDGRVLRERMAKLHLDEDDILAAARRLRGLDSLDQIAFAVLEKSGGITIVPKENAAGE